jgi:hypothetical protein
MLLSTFLPANTARLLELRTYLLSLILQLGEKESGRALPDSLMINAQVSERESPE